MESSDNMMNQANLNSYLVKQQIMMTNNQSAHNSFLPNIKSRNPAQGGVYGQKSHSTLLQNGAIGSMGG
jgi:hypothetical protein